MRCPQCQALMEEGTLPVSGGMHWIRRSDRKAGELAEDIPGTHAIMRPNRLIAWRCKKCELILFRFGRQAELEQQWTASAQASEETA